MAAYEASVGGGRGGNGGGRGGNTDGLTGTGEVWILQDGEPVLIRVRTGLADTQFTEIQADNLGDGDEIITRAIVLQND